MPDFLAVVIALFPLSIHAADISSAQEIVRKAASVMQADWAAAPGFAFTQRDVTTSRGFATSKTQQVFMIAGSDYYMPIAINGMPLSADQRRQELEKLRQEVGRRDHETPEEAERRSEQYRKMRKQNEILLNEFTKAFDFTPEGVQTVNGHASYVFDATPRVAYHPPNRTAKILTGMRGHLWIDKSTFHWVKAEAEAVKPVSVFGIFAKVLPGTSMELDMTPVTGSIWQVSRFALDLRLSVFWRKSTKMTETIFSYYQRSGAALARAVAGDR